MLFFPYFLVEESLVQRKDRNLSLCGCCPSFFYYQPVVLRVLTFDSVFFGKIGFSSFPRVLILSRRVW